MEQYYGRGYVENHSHNTYENAKHVLGIVQRNNYRSIILLAQQLHARRAKLIFIKVFQKIDIEIYIKKSWSAYGQNYQWRYHHFIFFFFGIFCL